MTIPTIRNNQGDGLQLSLSEEGTVMAKGDVETRVVKRKDDTTYEIYQGEYRDRDGKRRSVSDENKAQDKLMKAMNEVEAGTHVEPQAAWPSLCRLGLRYGPANHRRYLPDRPAKELRQPMFDFVLPTNAPCGPSFVMLPLKVFATTHLHPVPMRASHRLPQHRPMSNLRLRARLPAARKERCVWLSASAR